MNIDHILRTFNACEVEYLLIGGMNFLLRHEPVLTYDIDFWIRDTAANLARCDKTLRHPDASWGMTQTTHTDGESFAEESADRATREHELRERAWQPAARWQALQETIRWAESQATARRNTPRACIERERRIREGQGLG